MDFTFLISNHLIGTSNWNDISVIDEKLHKQQKKVCNSRACYVEQVKFAFFIYC